jgi:hypothetical protein
MSIIISYFSKKSLEKNFSLFLGRFWALFRAIFVDKTWGVDVMITIFCDFPQFSTKKIAFFSKPNVMIKILHILALLWVKNANFFAEFFGKNFLKIITSVPGRSACSPKQFRLRCSEKNRYLAEILAGSRKAGIPQTVLIFFRPCSQHRNLRSRTSMLAPCEKSADLCTKFNKIQRKFGSFLKITSARKV